MATLELGGASSPVDGIHLRLAASAGPLLQLELPANHPWKLEDGRSPAAYLGTRGELIWGDHTISFRVTGFRAQPGGADRVVGVTLSDDTLDWFEQSRVDTLATRTLVYQRQTADANGWAFLRRVLGNKFAVPHGSEQLDECLPVGTVVLRPAGCDNLIHQNRVLGLMRNSATRPWGWCAFDTQGADEPLRILGLDAPVFVLDEGWSPADISDVSLPSRVVGEGSPVRFERKYGRLDDALAADLLREVTRAGIEQAAEGLFDGSEQVLTMPTQIAVGGLTALCRRIDYHFDLRSHRDAAKVEFQTEIHMVPLPAEAALAPARLSEMGTFVEWDEASEKQRVVVKAPSERWQLMGDSDSSDVETADPEKGLVCDAVTPFASRDNCSGFYVSHRAEDQLLVQLCDGEVPRMVGMKQVYAEGLEGVDLVLNSATVSISGLSNDSDLATADGLAVDGAAGTVEVFADTHVVLKQKVTITDENTKADHCLAVTESAEIGGDTRIGGKTEIKGATTIKETLEVGS